MSPTQYKYNLAVYGTSYVSGNNVKEKSQTGLYGIYQCTQISSGCILVGGADFKNDRKWRASAKSDYVHWNKIGMLCE